MANHLDMPIIGPNSLPGPQLGYNPVTTEESKVDNSEGEEDSPEGLATPAASGASFQCPDLATLAASGTSL